MEKIRITEETIKNANAYVPLLSKIALARIGAADSIGTVKDVYRAVGSKFAEESGNLPPRWMEDTLKKELYLMGVFTRFYLKIYADEKNVSMAANEYDEYAESAVMNQIERIKSTTKDAEIKNKIFDMLYDFKQFTKMLGAEINGLLGVKNDTAARIMEGFSAQITPDVLEKAGAEMEKLQEEILKVSDEIKAQGAEEAAENG